MARAFQGNAFQGNPRAFQSTQALTGAAAFGARGGVASPGAGLFSAAAAFPISISKSYAVGFSIVADATLAGAIGETYGSSQAFFRDATLGLVASIAADGIILARGPGAFAVAGEISAAGVAGQAPSAALSSIADLDQAEHLAAIADGAPAAIADTTAGETLAAVAPAALVGDLDLSGLGLAAQSVSISLAGRLDLVALGLGAMPATSLALAVADLDLSPTALSARFAAGPSLSALVDLTQAVEVAAVADATLADLAELSIFGLAGVLAVSFHDVEAAIAPADRASMPEANAAAIVVEQSAAARAQKLGLSIIAGGADLDATQRAGAVAGAAQGLAADLVPSDQVVGVASAAASSIVEKISAARQDMRSAATVGAGAGVAATSMLAAVATRILNLAARVSGYGLNSLSETFAVGVAAEVAPASTAIERAAADLAATDHLAPATDLAAVADAEIIAENDIALIERAAFFAHLEIAARPRLAGIGYMATAVAAAFAWSAAVIASGLGRSRDITGEGRLLISARRRLRMLANRQRGGRRDPS